METTKQPRQVHSFTKKRNAFIKKMSQQEEVARTKFILLIASNTLDPTIGKGCKADIKSVSSMFQRLSKEMNFNFIELQIGGKDYSKENILDSIHALTPGANDIVLFYYSGHGFSYADDETKQFPQVDLRSHPSSENIEVINANTENLADLFQLIKSRGARLNIVIGDCCNSIIDFKRSFRRVSKAFRKEKKEPFVINKTSCEILFCDYTASILVASATKGEYAVSDDQLGSLFTFNFAESLKMLMKKEIDKSIGLPWKPLLEEVKAKTQELSKTYDIGNGVPGNQRAIYDIEFRETMY